MKIKLFTLALIALSFFACGDDDNKETYSTLEAEDHKEILEETGLSAVNKLSGLSDLETVGALKQWLGLYSSSMTVDNSLAETEPFGDIVEPMTQFASKSMNITSLLKFITNVDFSAAFDNFKGYYTYSTTTEKWTITESDNVIFNYALEGSTTNNATLTFSNFATSYSDLLSNNIPSSIDVNLVVDKKEIMNIKIRVSYNASGYPSYISENINIEDYSFITSISLSTSKIAFNQSLSLNNSSIYKAELNSDVDIDYNSIIKNMLLLEINEDIANQTILSSANASITVVDSIQAIGIINWDGLKEYVNVDFENEAAAKEAATAINNNMRLYFKYKFNNQIFAESEIYSLEDEDNEGDYETNYRFKFSDGSYYDSSYFDSGFEDLFVEYDSLLDALYEAYGISFNKR